MTSRDQQEASHLHVDRRSSCFARGRCLGALEAWTVSSSPLEQNATLVDELGQLRLTLSDPYQCALRRQHNEAFALTLGGPAMLLRAAWLAVGIRDRARLVGIPPA